MIRVESLRRVRHHFEELCRPREKISIRLFWFVSILANLLVCIEADKMRRELWATPRFLSMDAKHADRSLRYKRCTLNSEAATHRGTGRVRQVDGGTEGQRSRTCLAALGP